MASGRKSWGIGLVTFSVATIVAAACATGDVTDQSDDDDDGAGASTGANGGDGGTGANTGGAPACGNGEIDPGETCDGDCPTDCDDGDGCTSDTFVGSAPTCDLECAHEEVGTCLEAGDGCCPTTCTGMTDADCAVCDNGVVELGETCDGDCPTSCDDGNTCTVDAEMGDAATCDLTCDNDPITTCTNGDDCCPASCTSATDDDCSNDLIVVYAGAYSSDVQTKLQSTGSFPVITMVDGSATTPTLAQLQMHDVAFVYSDSPSFIDPVALGNNLADFYDAGGRVVTATFARCTNLDIQGRFGDPAQGYVFFQSAGQAQPSDSLGPVAEPMSPLMAGVTTLSATSAYRCTGTVINGGVVVASWASLGSPLIVRGTVQMRNRVDLNFYPPSIDIRSDFWSGDGLAIMKNALLYH
jgi:hypothetical protein